MDRSGRRPAKNSDSLPNIKRIDSDKTHGWQVHLRRGGILKTKLFSDSRFDGKARARAASIVYRDQLVAKMAHLAKPLWRIERVPRSNTGQLGVSFTEAKDASGKLRKNITVTVRPFTGKAVNRKFSVDRLGYDTALKRAVAWRKSVLRDRAKREKENGST